MLWKTFKSDENQHIHKQNGIKTQKAFDLKTENNDE